MESRPAQPELDYRAFMTCAAGNHFLDNVHAQLNAWLREKEWDVDVHVDGRHTQSGRALHVRHHGDKRSRSLHARLIESGGPQGTWTTELLAHDQDGERDWISLTVENDEGRFVDVPRLAKYLMQALPLGDGRLQFVDHPQVFGKHQVDDLIDVLCEPDRRSLVFVAGSANNDIPFDAFASRVGTWTRQAYGLAQVVALDPNATEALNANLGAIHGVSPWTIRTFLPAVDPASREDARRHRTLGTHSLSTLNDSRIRLLLGSIARSHAAERPTPAPVIRTRRDFERIENLDIVHAIQEAPRASSSPNAPAPTARPANEEQEAGAAVQGRSPSEPRSEEPREGAPSTTIADQASRYLAQLDLVRAALGIDALDEGTLRELASRASAAHVDASALDAAAERIRMQEARIERLEDDLASLKAGFDEESLERAVLQGDLDDARAEVRWLRARLGDRHDFEGAFAPAPARVVEEPQNFPELMDKLPLVMSQGVVFTGDEETLLSLEASDTGNAVRAAWDAIRALADYVRARRDGTCNSGVHEYLGTPPSSDYFTISQGKHAAGESESTMNAYGKERVFPVPPEVDASGWCTMTAHFRLARIGMISPRLYYLDDVANTGRVYIGYIGPHLRNTQTN